MKKTVRLSLLLLAATCIQWMDASSQTVTPEKPTGNMDVLPKEPMAAAPGTYQFIVTEKGAQEAFLKDLLVTAERLRRQHETVYYRLSQDVTLKVLSQDEICSKDFKPQAEFVIRRDHE